jgi:hypothetical protein
MAKIQQCRNNCGKLITVEYDGQIGKYVPYEVDTGGNPTGRHNCPNSEYNRKNQGQQQGQSITPNNFNQSVPQQQAFQNRPTTVTAGQAPIDRPTMAETLLSQINQKMDNSSEYIKEKLEQNYELNKVNNIMLNALVEHFNLNQPKTAAELWALKHPDASSEEKYQQEREQIAKWNQSKDVQSEDKELEDAGI